ncbi:hypothetical protein HUB98_13350 [Paenibacillus barcinonensis]|uniref:Uncharacterized protein n=1 Tax=Paenibacillus barcinonensis TaxID=198119 RepID=A0A2V4V840_PAEBA|nr:hypothetical protein [Paenibacillus barcinonensis]PYE42121.1 hypothetical protein DFQ00_14218 [Paenibacillus barcinonensis]QKS57205.1 hypothetical protein HUB98_13350 [Paenibacillus barcinonensis]
MKVDLERLYAITNIKQDIVLLAANIENGETDSILEVSDRLREILLDIHEYEDSLMKARVEIQ